MEHVEGTFEGVKGLNIYYQAWIPETSKAVVQFLHGVTEHSGRFPHLVEALTKNNFILYADDHRGHGKSEGMRIHVDSFNDYVEDQKRFHDVIRKKYPNLPIIMVGYSLGAAIAFEFGCKYKNLVNGGGRGVGRRYDSCHNALGFTDLHDFCPFVLAQNTQDFHGTDGRPEVTAGKLIFCDLILIISHACFFHGQLVSLRAALIKRLVTPWQSGSVGEVSASV